MIKSTLIPVRPLALLLVALLSGCATAPGPARRSGADVPLPALSNSPLGNYLAGRFARSQRDNDAAADFFILALNQDPDDPTLTRRAFIALIADGRMDEATRLAQRLLQGDARDDTATMLLAAVAMRKGDYAGAARRADGMNTGGFNALLGPVVGAWAHIGAGDADGALKSLDALNSNPAFAPFGGFHIALVNDVAGRLAAADAAYRAVLDKAAGGTLRVIDCRGRLLERSGKPDQARTLYESFLQQSPDNAVMLDSLARLDRHQMPEPLVPDAAAGLAEAFYGAAAVLSRDESNEAFEVYLRMSLYLRPDLAPARMLLGDLFEGRHRYAEAINAYEAVDRGTAYSDLARLRIAWCMNEMGRSDDAVARLQQLAIEKPSSPEPLITLADMLRNKERFADAAREYDRALERIGTLDERHWSLLYARGIAHERSKQWGKAEADFLAALKLRPDQPLVMNYLGYSWLEQGLHVPEARKLIERAVELRPNDGYVVDSLGWVLYREGRYQDAVVQLERAVELKPEDPVINDHLGDIYWRVGRETEARFQWERALALKPEPDQIAVLKRKIDNGLDPVGAPLPQRAVSGGG